MPFHPTLFAIRGLPGSGKSSLGLLLRDAATIAADDYFIDNDDGIYRFDPSKLSAAHADCLQRAQRILALGNDVAVCNTFSQRWELEPYITAAAAVYPVPARLVVMDLYDGGLTDSELAARNLHGVPEAGINRMRLRWEHDWKAGNPNPPRW